MGAGIQTVEKFFTNRSGQKLNLIIHSTNVRIYLKKILINPPRFRRLLPPPNPRVLLKRIKI